MRYTKKVSVWPVGLVGGLKWEGPICKDGSVVKFYTVWQPTRPMPIDMAGFAINAKLFIDNPEVEMDPLASRGYLESSVVSRLAKREEFEPLANNCKQVHRSLMACLACLLSLLKNVHVFMAKSGSTEGPVGCSECAASSVMSSATRVPSLDQLSLDILQPTLSKRR